MSDQNLLTDEDMAELLGIGVPELRKKLSRGENLPPSCKLPGMRKRIWLERSFLEWLQSYETQMSCIDSPSAEEINDTWGKYK